MAKVFAQIVVTLELDEQTVNGTRLDLMGLSSVIKGRIEELREHGPKLRVLEVESPTKDWQIGAQLNINQPFNQPEEEGQ